MFKFIRFSVNQFSHSQSFAGVLLALAALAALLVSNSPWSQAYHQLLRLPVELRWGTHQALLSAPLVFWVNDLWMAVFFFLVGLEIKRELLVGELASPT
jgi:NhaA family Na+:H+ antiporter